MTSRQIQQSNNQTAASNTYQYYNDGALRFSHALDDRFDRAFSYDNAARVSESYSGSEARDFINAHQSGTATGPFSQSYQYTQFNQVGQETNRIWDKSTTTTNNFVNNRRDGWSYDADGQLVQADASSYSRDAASQIGQVALMKS